MKRSPNSSTIWSGTSAEIYAESYIIGVPSANMTLRTHSKLRCGGFNRASAGSVIFSLLIESNSNVGVKPNRRASSMDDIQSPKARIKRRCSLTNMPFPGTDISIPADCKSRTARFTVMGLTSNSSLSWEVEGIASPLRYTPAAIRFEISARNPSCRDKPFRVRACLVIAKLPRGVAMEFPLVLVVGRRRYFVYLV
ncbi:protein of unknown function (plasmid) [Cupriavidus taiwanensis]|nr:protein of unknown function [Cupriavidus taiwanensis]